MDSDSKEDLFVNLSSNQERLMKEMNAYLSAISYSPGGETCCSAETRKADNMDRSSPLSERLKVPSYSDASTDKVDAREVGNEAQKKVRSSRKNPNNLNSIDENGGHEQSSAQYEYYNDFSRDSSHGDSCNQFEDDSLIAMAKRMDAASIVSDPSMIVGPSEKFLALPHPKNLTAGMKKLGQKMQSNRATKPAPPPKNGSKSPRPPAQRLSQKMTNPQNSGPPTLPLNQLNRPTKNPKNRGMQLSLPFNAFGNDEVSNLSETNHTGQSTISSGSTSPSIENIARLPVGDDEGQINDKNYARTSSSGSAKYSEHGHGEEVVPDQPAVPLDTKARRESTPKGTRISSSKNAPDNKQSRVSRRGSRKHNRKHASRLGTSPIAKSPGNDVSDYLPANLKSASTDKVKNASGRKSKKKSKRDSSKPSRKKDCKKRQQKQQNDSDDEPMRGVGFNTRIHDKNNDDIKPNSVSEQVQKQCDDKASKQPRSSPSPTSDSKRGIGCSTRIHDKIDDSKPNSIPDQMANQYRDNSQSPKKTRNAPSQAANSESQTTYYYESSESETSAYSSDDQTQIFYESTDDEDFTDSEDELVVVGMSVEDAVKDLNNKRAVTKVKNLFGIRG